jgi:cysteine synthase
MKASPSNRPNRRSLKAEMPAPTRFRASAPISFRRSTIKGLVDQILQIKSDDAIAKANALAQKGYFLGISSGAAILAAEKIATENAPKGLKYWLCRPMAASSTCRWDIYGK